MTAMMEQDRIEKKNEGTRMTAGIVALFQRGIIQTIDVVKQLKSKQTIDDEALDFIRMTFEKGLKLFGICDRVHNLQNDLGLFQDVKIFKALKQDSQQYLKLIKMIQIKQSSNALIKNKNHIG